MGGLGVNSRKIVSWCLGALVVWIPAAEAHTSKQVKWEEIHVFRDRIVLFVRYEISEPRFVTDLRERFDIDGDKRLSDEERKSVADYGELLALEDLRLHWNGQRLSPAVTLKTTSGLDRDLPSAYPVVLYWQVEFHFPTRAKFETLPEDRDTFRNDGSRNLRGSRLLRDDRLTYELIFEDKEARWNSPFSCRVRLAPGIEEESLHSGTSASAASALQSFEFPTGHGSFKMNLFFRARGED